MEFHRFRRIWSFGISGVFALTGMLALLAIFSSRASSQSTFSGAAAQGKKAKKAIQDNPKKGDSKKDVKGSAAKSGEGKADSAPDESSAERRAELVEAFKKVIDDEPVVAESKNLILVVPKSISKTRAQAWVNLAEKHRDLAVKTLELEPEEVQETKLGIFLWANGEQLRNYIRRVERRTTEKDDTSSINTEDWMLRASGIIPPAKEGALVDHRAGELAAGLVLGRRARRATSVPEWLSQGFGRATTWKLAPPNARPLLDEKRKAALLARKYNGWEVLNGNVSPAEAPGLQASALFYLAFVGTYAPKFSKFVEGFEPDDNNNPRGLPQALQYAKIGQDDFSSSWKTWAGGR